MNLDAAGWLFWVITFLVVLAPCIWGAWQIPYTTKSPWIPIVFGAVGAAVAAGLVSWAVNAVLQWRRKRQRIAERKKLKKQK